MSDPEITPSEPADGDRGREHHGRHPSGDDIPLPEEQRAGDETVEADTASGGAPEPAGDDDE